MRIRSAHFDLYNGIYFSGRGMNRRTLGFICVSKARDVDKSIQRSAFHFMKGRGRLFNSTEN